MKCQMVIAETGTGLLSAPMTREPPSDMDIQTSNAFVISMKYGPTLFLEEVAVAPL